MQTNQPQKTRLQCAAERATQDLANVGRDEEKMRRVAFDLLRAWSLERVASYAEDAPKEGDEDAQDLEDWIHETADSMAIYTADNLATLIGSENWQAAWEEGLAEGPEPNWAAIAYAANAADLRRYIQVERA